MEKMTKPARILKGSVEWLETPCMSTLPSALAAAHRDLPVCAGAHEMTHHPSATGIMQYLTSPGRHSGTDGVGHEQPTLFVKDRPLRAEAVYQELTQSAA